MSSDHQLPKATRAMEVARLEIVNLPSETPLNQVLVKVCEQSAKILRIERVGVWFFVNQKKTLRCANLYELTKNEHSNGTVIQVSDFPSYFAALTIRKAVPAEIATTDPATKELASAYLRPLNIVSVLDAGIFVDNSMVGVVCLEQVGQQREWSTEERDFAGSMADLIATRMQSAEMKELRNMFFTPRDTPELERSPSMEQFTAGIVHDFRNLLGIFVGYGELLQTRKDSTLEIKEIGRSILVAAEKGIHTSSELLYFTRPKTQPPVVLDLTATTANYIPLMQSKVGEKYKINFKAADYLGQVFIDANQYTRVLMNLVTNASEAMPNGGQIDVILEPIRMQSPTGNDGRYVHVRVTDQGSGMEEATKKQIFAPYFTTKSQGTGLGLAIVKQIIDRANGTIRIDTTPKKGTTFHIFLPRIGSSTGSTMTYTIPEELMDKNSNLRT